MCIRDRVYKATWPDEKKILCTVGTMARRADEAGLTKTTMILIGGAVALSLIHI